MKTDAPHWSASQFMLFEQCPFEYRRRYVDGEALEPTEAMSFGKAVHLGLEAHFNGEDGERLFRAVWKAESDKLGPGQRRDLTGVGLTLLDKVAALGLKGIAECEFSIKTDLVISRPIVGAIDLWGRDTIYDFKTTRGVWSQKRAQTECWQPILYSWAALEQTGKLPAFEYIVLNRVTGQLDRFRREWDEDLWAEQWGALYDRMCSISTAVAASQFACHDQHGSCPECGARYSHDHVCDPPSSKRIRL